MGFHGSRAGSGREVCLGYSGRICSLYHATNTLLRYYADLYQNVLKREATREELFDLAQGNSEHSRHWSALACLLLFLGARHLDPTSKLLSVCHNTTRTSAKP